LGGERAVVRSSKMAMPDSAGQSNSRAFQVEPNPVANGTEIQTLKQ
jgi:hypothetical protein